MDNFETLMIVTNPLLKKKKKKSIVDTKLHEFSRNPWALPEVHPHTQQGSVDSRLGASALVHS